MLKTMTFMAKKTAKPIFSNVRRAVTSEASDARIDAAKRHPLQQ
jgi:hypothetical protein